MAVHKLLSRCITAFEVLCRCMNTASDLLNIGLSSSDFYTSAYQLTLNIKFSNNYSTFNEAVRVHDDTTLDFLNLCVSSLHSMAGQILLPTSSCTAKICTQASILAHVHDDTILDFPKSLCKFPTLHGRPSTSSCTARICTQASILAHVQWHSELTCNRSYNSPTHLQWTLEIVIIPFSKDIHGRGRWLAL